MVWDYLGKVVGLENGYLSHVQTSVAVQYMAVQTTHLQCHAPCIQVFSLVLACSAGGGGFGP